MPVTKDNGASSMQRMSNEDEHASLTLPSARDSSNIRCLCRTSLVINEPRSMIKSVRVGSAVTGEAQRKSTVLVIFRAVLILSGVPVVLAFEHGTR